MIRERGLNFWFPSEIAQEFLPAFNVLERSVQSKERINEEHSPTAFQYRRALTHAGCDMLNLTMDCRRDDLRRQAL